VLRNPADHEVVSTPGASTQSLFAGTKIRLPKIEIENDAPVQRVDAPRAPSSAVEARAAIPPPSRMQTVTVEVYQGARKVESTFRNPEAPRVPEAQ
jgi:hypothetical protein